MRQIQDFGFPVGKFSSKEVYTWRAVPIQQIHFIEDESWQTYTQTIR
jgi:hypothetical protein